MASSNFKFDISYIAYHTMQIPKKDLGVSLIFGGLIGLMTSIMTNFFLLEIAINPVFSTYFGIIFIVVGALMYLRATNVIRDFTKDEISSQISYDEFSM